MLRDLGAVVVSHNSSRAAIKLVAQLTQQGVGEVVVVDSGSSAKELRTLCAISGMQGFQLECIKQNVGFGTAVNVGVAKLSKRLLVLICNADIELEDGFAERIVRTANSGPGVIVSPRILSGDREDPVYWFRGANFVSSRGYLRHKSKGLRPSRADKGLIETQFAPATALLVPRQLFERVNGFREDLFMYWEDADFSLKTSEAGGRMVCDLEATVWHEVGGSEPKLTRGARSPGYYYYMQRNRLLVFGPLFGVARMFWGRGLLQVLYPFLNIVVRDRGEFIKKLRASFLGILDGLSGVAGRTWL